MKKLVIIIALVVFGFILYLIKLPTEFVTVIEIIGAVCGIIGIITIKDDEKKNVLPVLILLVLAVLGLLAYVYLSSPEKNFHISNPIIPISPGDLDSATNETSPPTSEKNPNEDNLNPVPDTLPETPKPISLDNIYGLEINQSINVIMSEKYTTLAVDGTLSDYIDFDNQGNTLKIGIKEGTYCDGQAVTVMLPNNPNLNSVICNGNSTFTTENALLAKDISIHLNGNSSFAGTVFNDNTININANGSSTATINGIVNQLNLSLLGNTNLDAGKLEATSVFVNMVGNSTANVLCCEYIKVEAVGNAKLVYETVSEDCSPTEVFTQIGNSTIRKR